MIIIIFIKYAKCSDVTKIQVGGAFSCRISREEGNYHVVVKQDTEVVWLLRPWCCLPGVIISLNSSFNK